MTYIPKPPLETIGRAEKMGEGERKAKKGVGEERVLSKMPSNGALDTGLL